MTTKKEHGFISKYMNEFAHFKTYPRNMRILLITNLLYSMVLPIIEIFIGAYIMRNTSNVVYVIGFQLAIYSGIPMTFILNGFLLRKIPSAWLYSFGMMLSGVSMAVMMMLNNLDIWGVVVAGLIMGISYGFFWANRDMLSLNNTTDENRNYYYGLECFFYTSTGVVVPYVIGAFIGAVESGWFVDSINTAYHIITALVFVLTLIASSVVFKGDFENPKDEKFLYWKFDKIWKDMSIMAALKGMGQGYIVTAPAMLIMSLVGNENTLGIVQSTGAILSAILLYILGRVTQPKDRLLILGSGLTLFLIGSIINASLYSAFGVILFMLCLVLSRPLLDLGYFPIQMRVINHLEKKENRCAFTYIFAHEIALYIGRLSGCGLFIVSALCISETFALRYALLIIGIVHLSELFIANIITKRLDSEEGKEIK